MKLNSKTEPGFNPTVELVNCFQEPYNNAVATARTCYSSRIIHTEEVRENAERKVQRDQIAASTYLAGHHTTLQHAHFQFAISGVSRHLIWSFLHSHPFYNSEQVSQRYVSVKEENFVVPPLTAAAQERYLVAIQMLMQGYETLNQLLLPTIEAEFKRIFPARDLSQKKWTNALRKRAQEVARYVLPLATTAHLYHTISGVTLLRYLRTAQLFDAPQEQKILVQKMRDAVEQTDPDFFRNAEPALLLEDSTEFSWLNKSPLDGAKFIAEFDHTLCGKTAQLVRCTENAPALLAESVRHVLGATKESLSDAQAIALVLDPQANRYLAETLNLNQHTKLGRTLAHIHFTFRKKISHTADSQDQRHRTVPASRPILAQHFTGKPDYITPQLIAVTPAAAAFYHKLMQELWQAMQQLLDLGTPLEHVLYLLPNAFPIRYEESGTLLDLHHKWTHRLCYTAQEEIWQASKDEVASVKNLFPQIAEFLAAPCALRKRAGRKPFCPEGDRFCGVPVWQKQLEDYNRLI